MAEHHHSFMFFLLRLLSVIQLVAAAQELKEPSTKEGGSHFDLLTKVCEKKEFENVTNFVVNFNEANNILIRENFFAPKAGQTSTGKEPYKIYYWPHVMKTSQRINAIVATFKLVTISQPASHGQVALFI